MSRQTEKRVRLAGAILLILISVAVAPLLDDVVGFLSDAPYVEYLPLMVERGTDSSLSDVLTSAWSAATNLWCGRVLL